MAAMPAGSASMLGGRGQRRTSVVQCTESLRYPVMLAVAISSS
jgi:hypothetical protein